jgi:hypothetical protein
MSSAIIIKQTDAVHLISDAAAYDTSNGTLLAIGPKSFSIAHLNAAVACRGDLAALPLVNGLGFASNYNGLHREAGRILADAEKQKLKLELFIGGFLPTGESDAFMASTGVAWTTDIPGFAVVPMPPGDNPICAALANRAPDDFDPLRDGLAIIEAQRRHAVDGMFIVGGWASLISVYRDRIEQRILTRWPDKIGQPINPHPALAT